MYALWVEQDGRFAFSEADNGGRKITDEAHAELFGPKLQGKIIGRDKNGFPQLQTPPPLSIDKLASIARQWRDAEIESVKWLRERHRDEVDSLRPTTLTVEQSGELLDYVQALRDWPKDASFPATSSRPTRPAWIAA